MPVLVGFEIMRRLNSNVVENCVGDREVGKPTLIYRREVQKSRKKTG